MNNIDTITRASAWARDIWLKSLPRWTAREGQDLSYRRHVVHPAIDEVLLPQTGCAGGILDLGCGDGILLTDTVIGDIVTTGGRYMGVDTSPALIDAARSRNTTHAVSFLCADIADPAFVDGLAEHGGPWDCVVSVFVVQEMPDARPFACAIASALTRTGAAAVVTVHPRFAEALREQGAMPVEDGLESTPSDTGGFRWAGRYPIVDEPLPSFMLPYFHRTLKDYTTLFAREGLRIERLLDLPDPIDTLPRLVSEGVSPFTPFPGNDYWPHIAAIPSALGLILRREDARD